MKEKRYILPDEKKDAAFAAEPIPSYHGNAAMVLPEEKMDIVEDDDDIDWDRIPIGWCPANEEEAIARIEAIEDEYDRTGKNTDWNDFIKELKEEGLWLI